MKTLAERLKHALEVRGRSPADLARAISTTDSAVSQWLSGQIKSMRGTNLMGASAFLKVNALWLSSGKGKSGLEEEPDVGAVRPVLAWEHEEDLPPGEFVLLPRLEVKLSAGNGHELVEVELQRDRPQAFRAEWIRKRRLKPSRLVCMEATGNSMEDRIFDGDSLVVDISQREVIDGKTYALWYDGGERVKKLYRMPGGGLRIKSNNPEYPEIVLGPDQLEHVRIIGRVVHIAGEGGL